MSFSTLIDAAELAANLGAVDWCVIDARHQLADTQYGERAFAAGHIPGAQFLHCDRDLSGPMTGTNGRHPLPDTAKLAERFAACGIGADTQVVVYDDAQGMIAGRVWWLLRWLGHTRVALLDGGWQAWLAAGGATSSDAPKVVAKPFIANLQTPPVDAASVLAKLGSADMLIVDARSPDRFRGENETMDPVGGHIPGAINRFFRDNLAPDGRFKSPEALRAEWLAVLGQANPENVVHQCGSGVSACHNMLAMERAGLLGSRLYAGSWSEWCADPSRPVAR